MHLLRSLLLACPVLVYAFTAHAQVSPNDAMQTCKNTASDRLPNVPRAFINVQRGSDAGSNYMINFRSSPPNGRPSSGFCIIAKFSGRMQNFQFDAPMPGGNPGGNSNSGGGYNDGRISPQQALEACKNKASERMPGVPRAFISVYRGTNGGDGSFVINFRAQPPQGRAASGFCNITWNGAMRNFQLDAPPPPSTGGNPGYVSDQNFGGRNPIEAMRSCKTVVSERFPSVPLAFIEVDSPRVNGGSLLSVFRVRAPNGLRADGSCDIFKNGKVNLTIR